MQIVEDKALVVQTKYPNTITSQIKNSAVVEQNGDVYDVAVKWGLKEARALATIMGSAVPSPIKRDYKWTGKLTPFAHQKETASFFTIYDKAFCFNQQGTGKTASVIWAADYLMKLGLIKRVLVLCPLSIMKSAWQQDLFKFAMHRSCSVAHGDAKARKKILTAKSEFVIMNFDGLAVVKDEVMAATFDLIVVDECFVAGTLVQTPEGPKAIETLRAGDKVFTSNGAARIKTVKWRESTDVVRVGLSNGEQITCTGEHPFFTDIGWVAARNLHGRRLVSRTDVSGMRERVPSQEAVVGVAPENGYEQVSDLLKILRTEEVAPEQPGEVALCGIHGAARARGERGGAQPRVPTADVGSTQSIGAPPASTGRERHGDNSDGVTCAHLLTPQLGMELPGSVGAEAARLSYELQARLCTSGHENWPRSGRDQSPDDIEENAGSEERAEARGVWVESVSYNEHGGSTSVFNLEVEGTPNYFVGGGYLVHNCNAYKNSQTRRWKVLRDVSAVVPRLWMLTGTPAAQSPTDAYGLAKLVNPDGVPKFFGSFRDQVMMKITQFKWAPKNNARDIVHHALQPAIRFERDQCLDLPPVTHVERDAPLTPQQNKYYNVLRQEMLLEAAGESVTAVNAAVKLNKLLQISSGAVYSDAGAVIEFDVSNRLNVVLEVIEEASNKVLVFVPFNHTIELLQNRLTRDGISCDVINGKVSPNRRADIVQEFQTRTDPHVLIIQPQAASHGLTLTAADTIIWYAPVTSVETYLQANARINRPGQKHPMTIVHIQGSPVEARLYKMLETNIDNHQQVIDLYRQELTPTP